jgi:hypothetical protein
VWAESESRKQKLELSIFRVRGYFKYVWFRNYTSDRKMKYTLFGTYIYKIICRFVTQ